MKLLAHSLVRIETDNAALVFGVTEDGKLVQLIFGSKAEECGEPSVAYPTWGDGWVYEPAFQATHSDGNTSVDLRVTDIIQAENLTRIQLGDAAYALRVDLLFRVYPKYDVIESWTEVSHDEPGEVVLQTFASSSLDFGQGEAFVTQFRGDWNDEVHMEEERLTYGLKVLDSKLAVRAHQFRAPWFLLARGGPAKEDEGEVLGGSFAWSGSFRFSFERLPQGSLRAICGINPFASAYRLSTGETFETPRMTWAYSPSGTGNLSRNLHAWTRAHVLRDGHQSRSILLNNWEATYFSFDETKIFSLLDGAKDLGIEMFLLDDGWFGTKHPRDSDNQGLGDWTPDPKKLPNGVRAVADAAATRGLRFGIWLEPEMVNPRSELFEAHPDWAIRQPGRELETQRNQLVLDLSNPDVEAYVFSLVDQVLSTDPGITYVKWDCNRYVTQPGSPYLPPDKQSHLPVLYVQALYRIFDRLAKAHPHIQIMMCSGGGGRVDLGAMRYAQEFWPSDNTDPARRVLMQWAYSQFWPPIAVSAHVTDMGHRPIDFAFAVAMSGRLGMDMDLDKLSSSERDLARKTVEAYKGIRDVVQLGTQYRLQSPFEGPRSALMSVLEDRAIVFVYSLGESPEGPLQLRGLDASRNYRVREMMKDVETIHRGSNLLEEGLPLPAYGEFGNGVFELTAV